MRPMMRAAAAGLVLAWMVILSGAGAAATWPQVETSTADGVRYANGGFGLEERDAMPAGFPLKIMFATEKGHYLSAVDVSVFDAGGKRVFAVQANDGPWLLVDLAAGRYRIRAVHNGHERVVEGVAVPARGTKAVLIRWKLSEVDMGLPE